MGSKSGKERKRNSNAGIETLPDLVLEKIVSFLPYRDLVHFCASSAAFRHFKPRVQWVVPQFATIDVQHFYGHELRAMTHGDFCDSYCPEKYMDVPVLTRGLKSIQMEFKWKDQGLINKRGQVTRSHYASFEDFYLTIMQVWLQLIQGDEVVADTREDEHGFCN